MARSLTHRQLVRDRFAGDLLAGVVDFGRSLRPFVALLLVFGMRQICRLVCPLPEPVDGLRAGQLQRYRACW